MTLKKLLERFKLSKNSNWKGDNAKTRAKHLRKGPATKCLNCGSTQNVEWAEMHNGKYKQLCKSCHSKYDNKNNNFNK